MPVFETRGEGIIVPAKSSRFYACLCSLADYCLHGLPKLTKKPADLAITAGVSTDLHLYRLAKTCTAPHLAYRNGIIFAVLSLILQTGRTKTK